MGVESKAMLLVAAATLGSSTIMRAKRTEELGRRQGLKGTKLLADGQGGTVEYLLTGESSSPRPLVVCENGLGEPLEAWDWVDFFLRQDHQILRYHRSGYGRTSSTLRPAQIVHLLLQELCPEAPFAYVGHSIGSLVMGNALCESDELRTRVGSVTVVDGTDPDLLQTERSSPTKMAKFRQVVRQRRLAGMIGFNWWGPDIMARQVAYRPDIHNAYRLFISDGPTFRAATTEYLTEPLSGLRRIWDLSVDRQVLAAADNATQQTLLARKLDSKVHVVEGSAHRSIIGYPEHAQQVAHLIRAMNVERVAA